MTASQKPNAAQQSIKIVEVGPRDGLQNEKTIITTDVKLAFIAHLVEAGLQYIEVTSFVHPKAIPQLYDALDVVKGLQPFKKQGVHFSALVPNMKGLDRALESGIREISVFTAASNSFTRQNINMTIDESFQSFAPVVHRAQQEGMFVRGYVSTAFYCPFEGKMDVASVLDVSRKLLDLGIDEISLGDTIGQATPDDVETYLQKLLTVLPVNQVAMHFHDTNGLAIENVEASLAAGVTIFDASAGGLGGCPYAPGASGNLATEALVGFLEDRGIQTGIDKDKLIAASQVIRQVVSRTDELVEDIGNLDNFSVKSFPSNV